MERKSKLLVVSIGVLVVVLILLLVLLKGSLVNGNVIIDGENYSSFVNCLNEKGFVLYGFGNNGFVDAQLSLFQDAKGEVNYIDCFVEARRCNGAVIYPSWKTNDGIVASGLSLGMLSTLSGCKLG